MYYRFYEPDSFYYRRAKYQVLGIKVYLFRAVDVELRRPCPDIVEALVTYFVLRFEAEEEFNLVRDAEWLKAVLDQPKKGGEDNTISIDAGDPEWYADLDFFEPLLYSRKFIEKTKRDGDDASPYSSWDVKPCRYSSYPHKVVITFQWEGPTADYPEIRWIVFADRTRFCKGVEWKFDEESKSIRMEDYECGVWYLADIDGEEDSLDSYPKTAWDLFLELRATPIWEILLKPAASHIMVKENFRILSTSCAGWEHDGVPTGGDDFRTTTDDW